MSEASAYSYRSAAACHAHAYLLPTLQRLLAETGQRRLFDLGCGNGALAHTLVNLGYEVIGVDPSIDGIREANAAFPEIRLETGSAYDGLADRYGTFPIVVSIEVVEHLYDPRAFARTVFNLLEPGGTAIISTPYHGYLKNVLIALSGKSDWHYTALWPNGHIKFWSRETLGTLLTETGFEQPRFVRVGRFPPLAKSMIAVARRPTAAP